MKQCNQCGKCCINYSNGGLDATLAEIDYWEQHRPDIFNYVAEGKIWMDPDTAEQLVRCPWLEKLPNQEKYSCSIYFDRPEDCRIYPVTITQMLKDECEMLEPRDRVDTKKAQKKLNQLMIDSRPAY